ncbi:cyclase family protein [Haloplasma contractile]|uniref:Kynurenine formamidase n=1 Tax=Haloplasma contractile SSD-17B TaxID=1033810 RepID=U2EAD9_9MOLU|nr:cyclase family protein [Haloplasma contractile]ERJ11801.1 Kynurenine formamidase protein [Haloplasma contractile SSD-17B]
MKIYDISMNINEQIITYKNIEDKKPKFDVRADFSNANHYETTVTLDMHTGTHIDAPLHMIENGDTMDAYPLENFIRKCKVIDLTMIDDKISKEDLVKFDINKDDVLLLKTKNSYEEEFNFKFVFLEQSGAEYLADLGILGVGIDALGIERSQPGHETHKNLLGKGIMIIEGLRLKDVEAGEYTLYAMPLKLDHVEAAPTRAILIED